MSFDNHINLLIGTVQLPPSPSTTGQTLTLMPGDGARFQPDMPVTLSPPDVEPNHDNSEIGYLTGVAGEVLTITRAQEGTTAMQIAPGWVVRASITVKTIEDLEDSINGKEPALTAGTAFQYYRGDKTWQPLDKSAVYSPATLVVAPANSGFKADYYTDGTNDEVQINQALVAANALSNGGVVRLKGGTYTISAPIKPLNNTKLQGDGMRSTIIQGSGSDFTALDNRDGTTAVPIHDIEICDLKIDMDAVAVVTADPIDVKCVFMICIQRMFLHGVWCYGSPGTGIGTDFLVDTIIDRCIVEKCGKAGIAGTNQRAIGCNGFGIGSGRYDNETWIISNCIAKNCGNNGFLIENLNSSRDSLNNQVVNCSAYECGAGFLVTGVSQVIMSNCIAYSNYTHGFIVNSDDALSTTNPKRVLFNNCIATHNGTKGQNEGAGFYIYDYFTAGNRLKNISIVGSISYWNTNHGIWIRNSKGVIISSTRIEGNRNQGIEFQVDNSTNPVTDVTITGNQILNNSNTSLGSVSDHSGIRLHTPAGGGSISGVVISGNRIYDDNSSKQQNYAIEIESTSAIANVTITGNDLSGNKNSNPLFIGSAAGKVMLAQNLGVSETVVRTGTTSFGRTESKILYNNSAPVTVTLPDATLVTQDRVITVKDYIGTSATNNITIATTGGQTIDGASTKTIAINGASMSFISDGTNWYSITQLWVDTSAAQTLTNKTISGASNTLTNIANNALTNSSVTLGSTSIALGATATTLAGLTLTTPTIASFVNATHNHTNAAGAGQLTATSALNATGTASSSTFLRGDNTWSTPLGSGDVSSNTASSVDSEVALFNSTTGKSIKRATGTGIATLASGVLGTVTAPTGAVVGDTDAQTLTNKTLTAPQLGSTSAVAQSGTLSIYNTSDQTTNYERARMYWLSNVFTFAMEKGGTGTDRGMTISSAAATQIGSGTATTVYNNSSGTAKIITTFSSGTTVSGMIGISNTGTLGATTGVQYAFAVSPTLTQSSTGGYTALLINPTETSTGSGTKNLIDAQVGGVSRHRVDNLGNTIISSAATSGLAVFNTSDETTNYERVRHYWNSGVYTIGSEVGGTGTQRDITLSANTTAITARPGGNFAKVIMIGSSASATGIMASLSGSLTSSSGTPVGLSITPTANQTSTAGYTALLVNPTETATGSGTKNLADFQVGGTSKTRIDNTGSHYLSTGASLTTFNTSDETTNYERGRLYWNSNVLTLIAEAGGTGSFRNMQISANGTFINLTGSGVSMGRNGTTTNTTPVSLSSATTFGGSSGVQAGAYVAPTINQSSTAGYTGLLVNPTETATGSGAKLLADFQVGGVSKAKIDNTGVITSAVGTASGNVATIDGSQTLTGKTISGSGNTITNIGNAALTNSAITIAGTSTSLGGTITQDTITGLSSTGLVKRTGANTLTTVSLSRMITVVIDGAGSAVTTGAKKVYVSVPYSGTITKWRVVADQTGSTVLDIWKDTFANFPPTVAKTITASAKPTLSSARTAESSTLTGWTTSVAAGDVIEVNVDSAATVTKLVLTLFITET